MKKYIIFISAIFMTLSIPSYSEVKSKEHPLVVILLGPPGAGKGTHALPLAERLKLPHISTGDLFRENITHKTALGKRVEGIMKEGKLVPDQLVVDMLFSRIEQDDCKEGFLLDGFPRSLSQAKELEKKLGKKANILVLHFSVPDSVLVKRITGRLVCTKCKAPFHKEFHPPKTKDHCDHCASSLVQRDDDKEDVLITRLKAYHKESAPLIEFYDFHDLLYDINSEKSQREVFEEVVQTIDAALAVPALSK